MPLIFTEDWIKELYQKYDSKWLKPPIFHLATASDERIEIRKQIESWVEKLSKSSQKRFIDRFKNEADFEIQYHELAVAGSLMKNGCIPEYDFEYKIDGKVFTPDWTVLNIQYSPIAIFEVFTINEDKSDEIEKIAPQIEDLRKHLSKIPINASLKISNLPSNDELTSLLNKSIAKKVRTWLSSSPSAKTSILVEGLRFEVLGYDIESQNTSVDFLNYSNASNYFDVYKNIRTIKSKIEAKIKKYKVLTEQEKLSFNIAIIPKSLASNNEKRLASIIEETLQSEDSLNSVLVLKTVGLTNWKDKIFYNPKSLNRFNLSRFE